MWLTSVVAIVVKILRCVCEKDSAMDAWNLESGAVI